MSLGAAVGGTQPASKTRGNTAEAAALALAVALYVLAWPQSLGLSDEAILLYEAKRMFDGDVLYRDIFDFGAPGAWYLIQAGYALFGVHLATAKATMAVIHGISSALLYASARGLGVRRAFAVVPSLGFVALCQPTFPHVSPHWFSSSLMFAMPTSTVKSSTCPLASASRSTSSHSSCSRSPAAPKSRSSLLATPRTGPTEWGRTGSSGSGPVSSPQHHCATDWPAPSSG